MLRKMPFILIVVISAMLFLDRFIPIEVKSILYALSLSTKAFIVFLLPIIIFGLLFKTAVNLAHHATKVIVFILVAVCCSNFISTIVSHYVGSWIYHFDWLIMPPKEFKELSPPWSIELPNIITNSKAMFSGLILGTLASLLKPNLAIKIALSFEKITDKLLVFFTYAMPLFVAGFVVKLNHEGAMAHIIEDYALIFVVIALSQLTYVISIYLLINKFRIKPFLTNLKNMLPAAIAGFSTMSSATAMPLTIVGVEKNSNYDDLAKSVVPATVNIPLIGDCFAIPIFAYAVLKNYGVTEPLFLDYIIFTCYFVLAKFSVAAIPGGGIIVMLPILEKYLGFNPEMMSLITALYILFDPIITCTNVLGNGAFAIFITRIKSFFDACKTNAAWYKKGAIK